jgi:hypothetical protein
VEARIEIALPDGVRADPYPHFTWVR